MCPPNCLVSSVRIAYPHSSLLCVVIDTCHCKSNRLASSSRHVQHMCAQSVGRHASRRSVGRAHGAGLRRDWCLVGHARGQPPGTYAAFSTVGSANSMPVQRLHFKFDSWADNVFAGKYVHGGAGGRCHGPSPRLEVRVAGAQRGLWQQAQNRRGIDTIGSCCRMNTRRGPNGHSVKADGMVRERWVCA